MRRLLYLIFFIFFMSGMCSNAEVYYTSPRGTEKTLSKITRDNPAEWRWITQFEGARELKCGDIVYLRHDQGIYTQGTRVLATGCSDTFEGAIHFMSEPGGFAVFKIKKFPNNNSRSKERHDNPSVLVSGAASYFTNAGKTKFNAYNGNNSTLGDYIWFHNIIMLGGYGDDLPRRDFGLIDLPYGSTGARDPGTIAGGQNYDNLTGGISIQGKGSRIINCLLWNLGKSGIGVFSGLNETNATFYGNIITNTGHGGPDRDHFHSVYQQWLSTNKGRLIHKHGIYQFSAEEGAQFWAQGGVFTDAYGNKVSKVDRIDIIENVLINTGTLSGSKHKFGTQPNTKIGGYTVEEDITAVGNISWHDQNFAWQSGFVNNGGNDRRNYTFRNNYIMGGLKVVNLSSIREVSGNTFVNINKNQLSVDITEGQESGVYNTADRWLNNEYYGGGRMNHAIMRWLGGNSWKSLGPGKLSFKQWQNLGFDKYSIYENDLPESEIRYFPNEYLKYYDSDKKGHFVVINWNEWEEVTIKLDGFGLKNGERFRIIDVQNIASDFTGNYLTENTYTKGMNIAIPLGRAEVVKDPTGEMFGPKGSDERFGVYLVVRQGKTQAKPPPVDPKPFDGKILGYRLDSASRCVEILTSGDVKQVVITPVGGFGSHTENNPEWTVCPWDMTRTGVDPEGTVVFDIVAFGPRQSDGTRGSIKEQITVFYDQEPDPVDPKPLPNDQIIKYVDSVFQLILFNQKQQNKINQEILKFLEELKTKPVKIQVVE